MGTRQNFNINTQAKLLDIHKQFQGGLKTVDTDDALQDFYLRQADNVSISEFGFLEKRYGLGEKEELLQTTAKVQGHFYYKFQGETDEILAAGGLFYIKRHGETTFTAVSSFARVVGAQYPPAQDIENFNHLNGTFQSTREIGAARIKNNLYIFTGSYPVFYSRVNPASGVTNPAGLFWQMPYYIPDWNEILSLRTGINLLIDDFDDAYGYNDLSLSTNSIYKLNNNLTTPVITGIKTIHAPLIPTIDYQTESEDTSIQFNLQARINFEAPIEVYTTFSSFESLDNPYVWKNVTFNPKLFYPLSSSNVFDDSGSPELGGIGCATLNARGSYNGVDVNGVATTYYYECRTSEGETNGTGSRYYHLIPSAVKYKAAGALEWLDVPEGNIVDRRVYTNAYNASNFTLNNSNHSLSGHLDITSPGISYRRFENPSELEDSYIAPLQVSIAGFPVGDYDFQVTWEFEAHFKDGTDNNEEVSEVLNQFTVDYNNIQIEATKINAESLGYKEKPIWTCNKVIEHFGKLVVWGSETEPEYLFISHPEEHNWFPATATVKFDTDEDEPILSVVPFMNVLVVQSETKTWGLKGKYITPEYDASAGTIDTTDLYTPFMISPVYGTIAPKSVRPVRNRLYFLSREGVVELTNLAFAFDEKYNINELDRNIKNLIPKDRNAVAIQHDYQYWINFPETNQTFRYYVDKKAWVRDTYGVDENDEYEDNRYDFDGVFKYYSQDGQLSFISNATLLNKGPNTAVYHIVIDKSLPSDFGLPFKSTIETANLNQGYPFHPKKYMENRLDFTLQNEYNTSATTLSFTNVVQNELYAQFRSTLLKGHQYQLGLAGETAATAVLYSLDGEDFVATTWTYDSVNNRILFDVPYADYSTIDIKIEGTISLLYAVLKDNTYDHTLRFNTWSISEEGTLNLDNIGYDVAESEIEINLGTVFGPNETWVFDESDFGNRITAVKTVKLSGRGYNYKLFFTDRSRAKWTLESLGITFKFKRARGER